LLFFKKTPIFISIFVYILVKFAFFILCNSLLFVFILSLPVLFYSILLYIWAAPGPGKQMSFHLMLTCAEMTNKTP